MRMVEQIDPDRPWWEQDKPMLSIPGEAGRYNRGFDSPAVVPKEDRKARRAPATWLPEPNHVIPGAWEPNEIFDHRKDDLSRHDARYQFIAYRWAPDYDDVAWMDRAAKSDNIHLDPHRFLPRIFVGSALVQSDSLNDLGRLVKAELVVMEALIIPPLAKKREAMLVTLAEYRERRDEDKRQGRIRSERSAKGAETRRENRRKAEEAKKRQERDRVRFAWLDGKDPAA